MTDIITQIFHHYTDFHADSVEWCPHAPYQNVFVCGNYELNVETHKRVGKILLLEVTPQSLNLIQALETAAVLDQKWCHHLINGCSLLGVVNGEHCLEIYEFSQRKLNLLTSYKLDVNEEVMILSLDWSTGKYANEVEIVCSDSKGGCHRFSLESCALKLEASYLGHSYEVWISAFYYWDPNIFFTGGDDSLFLKFDKRCGVDAVCKNKKHEAGVTSIHSNAEKEFTVVTGSYDENVRLWDLRTMKEPYGTMRMPAPVWRLKWNPRTHTYLLAACMLGGAFVLDVVNNDMKIVGGFNKHQSMVYGADWSYLDESTSTRNANIDPIVLVHGGAGDIPASRVPLKIAGCKEAASKGYEILANGGTALDAAEAAVRVMEDDPAFNAGYGSVLNLNGEVEMDASIMIGNSLRAGAVSIVKDIAHPIRQVMEKTPHVILSGAGAKKFAVDQGFEILEEGALVTEYAKNALSSSIEHGGDFTVIGKRVKGDVGTVGAVVIDSNGTLVAATSTGGMSGKMVGRSGDTSQIGSGTYANKHGAISITGYGEAILKFCLAHTIIKEMENGKTAQEATSSSINAMKEQLNKTAGAITISKDGEVGIFFSSRLMSWAYITKNKLHYGIEQDQHEIEEINL